jgi:hypothetical protein
MADKLGLVLRLCDALDSFFSYTDRPEARPHAPRESEAGSHRILGNHSSLGPLNDIDSRRVIHVY